MRIPAGMRSESQKDTELNESKWTRQKECNLPARTEESDSMVQNRGFKRTGPHNTAKMKRIQEIVLVRK